MHFQIFFAAISVITVLALVIYKRQSVFNIVVYEASSAKKVFDYQNSRLIFWIKPKVRSRINAVLTMADPFLFVYKQELYLFYEEKSELNEGIIKAFKTSDLLTWEDLGTVLTETCHLSFPFVFEYNNKIYLMPETFDFKSLCLYHFKDFPYGCTMERQLMVGEHFVDSHIFMHEDIHYLFTNTSNCELRLFYSTDLINWALHPMSPIVTGVKYARSAGSIILIDSKKYRVAQDNSKFYGENFHIFEITKLSTTEYEESLIHEDLIKKDMSWNREGGHHFNSVQFKGRYISAFDGKKRISYLEKISYPYFRLLQKLTN
jgi:hypothetical protein